MSATRQKIIEFLERNQPSSIREISRALHLTDPDVFYHLQSLLKNGEIQPAPGDAAFPIHRGRPMKHYRLTRPALPQNTVLLVKALLAMYLPSPAAGEGNESDLRNLASLILPVTDIEQPLNVRIARLVQRLSAINYGARWEARRDGPLVIFSNCPYQALVDEFPFLCEMDRLLIENHLGLPAAILQTCTDPGKSSRQCRFAVITTV